MLKLRKAITFLELIMVVALFALVFGAILYFAVVAKESWDINATRISLQDDLRRVLTRIAGEMADSTPAQVTQSDGVTPLNQVQLDMVNNVLACVPNGQECVYSAISFRRPAARDATGTITAWTQPVTYALTGNQITRQDGANPVQVIAGNFNFILKTAGHGYNFDPNTLGCGFERLAANKQIKIILYAQRMSAAGKRVTSTFSTIVFLRN